MAIAAATAADDAAVDAATLNDYNHSLQGYFHGILGLQNTISEPRLSQTEVYHETISHKTSVACGRHRHVTEITLRLPLYASPIQAHQVKHPRWLRARFQDLWLSQPEVTTVPRTTR